jgi:hypothetical protein
MSFARRVLACLVGVAVVAVGADGRAGPWVPQVGHGYAKAWIKYLPGFSFVDGRGTRHDYGAYHELFANAYGELGVLPGLALWVHAPLVQAFALEDPRIQVTRWHVTPGDPSAGVRVRLARFGRAAFACESWVRAPLAPAAPVQSVYASAGPAFEQVGALRIGNGAWDVGGAFSMGYARGDGYVAGSVGGVVRSHGFDPAGIVTAEGGGRVARGRVGLRGRITGYLSLPVGTAPRHESPSGMGNGTRYWGFAFEGDVRVTPRWDVGMSLEGGIGPILRQTGGPVLNVYAATGF